MKQIMEGLKRDRRGRVVLGSPKPCPHCGYEAKRFDDVYRAAYLESTKTYPDNTREQHEAYGLKVADKELEEAVKKTAVHLGYERLATFYHMPFRCCQKAIKASKNPYLDRKEVDEQEILVYRGGE